MSYSLNSLNKGGSISDFFRGVSGGLLIKGDTKSLDYSSCGNAPKPQSMNTFFSRKS